MTRRSRGRRLTAAEKHEIAIGAIALFALILFFRVIFH